MEVLHSQKVFFPLCLLLSLHFSLPLLLGSAYTLPDKYFIDCGSRSDTTLTDGRIFVGDRKFSAGKGQPVENSNSSNDIYQTARVYREPSSYKLEINQNGTYMVRLHFQVFNTSSANLSDALFNVLASSSTKKGHLPASGFSLLTNFSIRNSTSSPVVMEFLLTIPQGFFRLHFIPSDQYEPLAFVNAIEVFLLPDNFISDNATLVTPAGDNSTYRGLLSQFLYKIHRISVGSLPVEQKDDKLGRNWESDDPYLLNKTAAKNSKTYTLEPNYMDQLSTQLSSKYIAPALVYQTAKELNTDDNSSIVTWRFPVKKNAKHFVRAHFCDIVSYTTNALWFRLYIYSNFSQYINSYDKSTELDTPFYFDFVVDSDDSGYMNISIGLQNDCVIKDACVNGRRIMDAYLNGLEIMEVMKETGPIPKERESKKNYFTVGSASVGAFLILIIGCMVLWKLRKTKCWCWCWPHDPYRGKSPSTKFSSLPEELCRHFSLPQIKTATNNFHSELVIGVGGFGNVYKGYIDEGTMPVAIKRLNPKSGQGDREFWTEIELLSQLRHINLVSLIGYCDDEGEMILVYDYMSNGTLRDHLYDTENDQIPWKKRLEICFGAARGLSYLHSGVTKTIIHRDVKTTNILLDNKWVAKVSDFGLSKTGLNDKAVSTMVKGTFGYLDPEYAKRQQLTDKSDVYSFGVVLFEVLCGRKALNDNLEEEQWNLAIWANKCIEKGIVSDIIDPYLTGKIAPDCFKVFMEIAESCVREQGIQRPKMNDVMEKLDFALKLQEDADATKERINPGGEHKYQEVLSFHCLDGPLLNGHMESDSGVGLIETSINSELTSLDSSKESTNTIVSKV